MSPHPRRLGAEYAHQQHKRVPITLITDGFTLTGPVTLTVTQEDSTTPSQTSTTTTTTTTTTPTPSVSTTSSSSTTSLQSSSEAFSAATSTVPEPSVSVIPASTSSSSTSGTAVPVGGLSESSGINLSGGAIAGIIIAVLFFTLVLLLFLLRNRIMRRRQSRAAQWMNKPTVTPYSVSQQMASYSDSAVTSPGTQFAAAQARAITGAPSLALPTASYNNSTTPNTGVGPSSNAVVKSTFIPSLPDELSITTGEAVRILQEFDDGWALCANGGGEQGMVPLECLDLSAAAAGRRESSLYGVSTIRR